MDENPDRIYVHDSGLLMVPDTHPDFEDLIRIQLENYELTQWKNQLQNRINCERSEIIRLKGALNNKLNQNETTANGGTSIPHGEDENYERIITHYVKENQLK